MIEKIVLDHLNDHLDSGVKAYMQHPSSPSDRFVLIEKTGSGIENHIKRATFAVQSYAESLYEAAVLNEKVKAILDTLIEKDGIFRSHLDSDYNFTDVTTKTYRYQAVYEIIYQEV